VQKGIRQTGFLDIVGTGSPYEEDKKRKNMIKSSMLLFLR